MDSETIKRDIARRAAQACRSRRVAGVCQEARLLTLAIRNECPACRERSLALTKLEECVMWATSAIVNEEVGEDGE